MELYDEDVLCHHGTLGMHWGIRRYQNPDGSLTPEGKKRYAKNRRFRKKIDEKVKEITEAKRAAETKEERRARLLKSTDVNELMRDVSDLSTDEIRERINRIKVEKELSSYMKHEPTKTEKIGKAANTFVKTVDDIVKFSNTPTGKILTKQVKKALHIENPKVDYNKVLNKLDRMTNAEVQEWSTRVKNESKMRDNIKSILDSYQSAGPSGQLTNDQMDKILKALDAINDKLDNI